MNILTVILFFNFLSEDLHGIFDHRYGGDYAAVTIGEVIRTPILLYMMMKIAGHLEYKWAKNIFIGLILLVILICLQGVAFQLDPVDCLKTFSKGMRWSYIFIAMMYAVILTQRENFEIGTMLTRIKWLIVIFYSIPIFLALFGIAGYKAYDDPIRQGYIGFIMNNNVAASLFVFMLPFYLSCRTGYDYLLLFLLVASGLLTGAKLVYLGFAVTLVGFVLWKIYSALFREGHSIISLLKSYRRPLGVIVLLCVIISFTSIPGKIADSVTGTQLMMEHYMAGTYTHQQTDLVEALSSGRTLAIARFLDWAHAPYNFLALVIGGGWPNDEILHAEVDWVDITVMFGLTGLLAYYGIMAFFLLKLYRKRRYPYAVPLIFMLLLATGASLTSGHTYDNSVIGILIGFILGMFFARFLPWPGKSVNFAPHQETAELLSC